MAERRMLWKSISLSKKVNSVSLEAALLFTWTIPHMDRDGFMEADPEYIKGAILPRRKEIPEEMIPQLINELVESGLWNLYEDETGKKYVKDPRWTEFQTLTKSREAQSKISARKLKPITNSPSPHLPLTDSSPTTHPEGKLREGNIREGKGGEYEGREEKKLASPLSVKGVLDQNPEIYELVKKIKAKGWKPGPWIGKVLKNTKAPIEDIQQALERVLFKVKTSTISDKEIYAYATGTLQRIAEERILKERQGKWDETKTQERTQAPEAIGNILGKLQMKKED